MRVADLSDSTRCVVARYGSRVHLEHARCGLCPDDASKIRAGLLNPDAPVCSSCEQHHERHGRATSRAHDFLMTAEPADLGLSDFGVKR